MILVWLGAQEKTFSAGFDEYYSPFSSMGVYSPSPRGTRRKEGAVQYGWSCQHCYRCRQEQLGRLVGVPAPKLGWAPSGT